MLNGSNPSCCKNLNTCNIICFNINKYDINYIITLLVLLDDKINSMYSEADLINTGPGIIKDL